LVNGDEPFDHRLDCLKAAASFMLPKLWSTEIKGTLTAASIHRRFRLFP
jgi:hypothetical protein